MKILLQMAVKTLGCIKSVSDIGLSSLRDLLVHCCKIQRENTPSSSLIIEAAFIPLCHERNGLVKVLIEGLPVYCQSSFPPQSLLLSVMLLCCPDLGIVPFNFGRMVISDV